jgi:long-chain fatty acid transport protein
MRRIARSLVMTALAAWGVTAANGQELIPPLAGAPGSFDFSLSNPGARSLGFGGAFVALADDATAAFANPAGLVKLERPEVSLEGRYWRYDTPFLAGGRLGGEPSGLGIDTDPGARRSRSQPEVSAVSFAAFVYPRERWSLALYHHRQLDFETRIETDGLFGLRARPFPPRYPEMRSRTESTIAAFGAAAGVRLGERWSVGAGVSRFAIDLSTRSEFYFPSRPTPDQLFAPVPFDPEHLGVVVTLGTEETDWGWHAGVLWRPDEQWGVGAFYRQGAAFPLGIEVRSGAGLPTPPGQQRPPTGTLLSSDRVDPLAFPDVYGLGVSWRTADGATTLSVEWDHVGYASILESFDAALGETGGALDDGNEVHLGAEYAFLHATPVVALRAGVWLDPDHQVRPDDRMVDPDDPDEELLGALFADGEDEWHLAVGIGVAFARLQIDLAADLSDRLDTLSVSTIYTF